MAPRYEPGRGSTARRQALASGAYQGQTFVLGEVLEVLEVLKSSKSLTCRAVGGDGLVGSRVPRSRPRCGRRGRCRGASAGTRARPRARRGGLGPTGGGGPTGSVRQA